jgi:hypothetical protein
MRRYRSHKVVEAGVVQHIDVGSVTVDDEVIPVPAGIFARGTPSIGEDYLVRYEDGYVSWSPKAAFEAGYDPQA